MTRVWRARAGHWLGSVGLMLALAGAGCAPSASSAPQPVAQLVVDPEVPVTPVDQRLSLANNSPAVVADPTEPRFLALATRVDNPDFDCALHLSGDGGRSWVPVQPLPELPEGAEKCYSPEVDFDAQGVLHYLFIGLQGPGNAPMGAFLVTSDDRGASFSPPRRLLGPERYMVRMAVDRNRGRGGRLHLVWLETNSDPPLGGLPPPPNPIMAAYSDDGGDTFSAPVQVSDPHHARAVAPALALGSDGQVHVLYYDLRDDIRDYQGLEGPTWEGKWSLVLATSADGGDRFEPGVVIDDGLVPPERVMLIYTMPPPSLAADGSGRLFAAWHDARSGDWDVFLRRSVDGGRSWEAPQRLNDDPPGNGRHQYLPRLTVSPGGRVDAVFYDRRNDRRNLRNEVFYAYSLDSGATFVPNIGLSSDSFSSQVGVRYAVPSAQGLIDYGSRIGLLSEHDAVVAAWTDTRHSEPGSARQEILAARASAPAAPSWRAWWPLVAVAVAGLALLAALLAARRRSRG